MVVKTAKWMVGSLLRDFDSVSGRVQEWDSKFPGPLKAITVNTVTLSGKCQRQRSRVSGEFRSPNNKQPFVLRVYS